jgi:hypothetical protein
MPRKAAKASPKQPKLKRMTAQQMQIKLRHDVLFFVEYYLWQQDRVRDHVKAPVTRLARGI